MVKVYNVYVMSSGEHKKVDTNISVITNICFNSASSVQSDKQNTHKE